MQNDNTIMINNFRTAIKDTNQILSLNISPGLLIIPSELTILKNPIPGYNNSITTSTLNMRFGVNQNLNKATPVVPLQGSSNSNQKRLVQGFGGGNSSNQKQNLLGSLGNDNTDKIDNWSLPIFVGTTILGLLVLELSFSRKEGVKIRAHASAKNQ